MNDNKDSKTRPQSHEWTAETWKAWVEGHQMAGSVPQPEAEVVNFPTPSEDAEAD